MTYEFKHIELLTRWRDHTSLDLASYRERRAVVGDLVSDDEDLALRRFLYSPYSDGAGGTLRVADYISLFNANNALLAPFMGRKIAGCMVPLAGNAESDLVNVGFVDGDRTPVGIQGDGQSWIETAIAVSDVDVGNCFVSFSAKNSSSSTNEFLLGSWRPFFLFKNSSDRVVCRVSDVALNTTFGEGLDAIYSFNASSISQLRTYLDNVEAAEELSERVPFVDDGNIFIGSQNSGGNFTTGLMEFCAIASSALTDAQRTSLYHAITQLNFDREQLL